jgi:hypothetical protein
MKPVTQADLARRYGYFLDHLARRGLLDRAGAAGAGIMPETVESLIEEGRSRWRSVTLAQTIYKLRRMSEIIAPDRNVSWLEEIEKDLALVAAPKPALTGSSRASSLLRLASPWCGKPETLIIGGGAGARCRCGTG